MTGVDADLATLRESSGMLADLAEAAGCNSVDVDETRAPLIEALARVEAELSRLREDNEMLRALPSRETVRRAEAAEAELRECRDSFTEVERVAMRVVAAEARCARLQQALAGLESAVRILDVVLRESAAEGLMSAEDYRSYVQGAWLGVDEAAEKASDALVGPGTPVEEEA